MQDCHNNMNKRKSDIFKYMKKNDSWNHIIIIVPIDEKRYYLI